MKEYQSLIRYTKVSKNRFQFRISLPEPAKGEWRRKPFPLRQAQGADSLGGKSLIPFPTSTGSGGVIYRGDF